MSSTSIGKNEKLFQHVNIQHIVFLFGVDLGSKNAVMAVYEVNSNNPYEGAGVKIVPNSIGA